MVASSRLKEAVEAAKRRLAAGERPVYHVTWTPAAGGAVDVRVVELPIVHVFVPDADAALGGARVLIARTLDADASAFDVVLTRAADANGAR